MRIEKHWFYQISQSEDTILQCLEGIHVCVFDTTSTIETIEVGEGVTLFYFTYFSQEIRIKKHFKLLWENSKVRIFAFNYSTQNQLHYSLTGEVCASNTFLDMKITSIVGEAGNINADGIVQINEDLKGVEWYLKQENIFLWNTGKIRGIPTLLVRSNDVKASHGCNIEKISDEKLFYLRSRGLEKDVAIRVMIESYVRNIFFHLETVDSDFYKALVEKIILSIQ